MGDVRTDSNTQAGLTWAPLGRPRLHLRVTDSTNDRARALAIAGAPHGTLVTAAEQTAGRGRQGRRWSAPAGSSLLASLILRADPAGKSKGQHPGPRSPAAKSDGLHPLLPLLAAVAVCDVAGEQAMVKWPNDIVRGYTSDPKAINPTRGGCKGETTEDGMSPHALAKLAGILVEARPQEGWAVLGIGLNVAVRLEELPADVRVGAATMGQTPAAIEPTLARLLGALERRLNEPKRDLLEAYRARDALCGRDVVWSGGRGRVNGVDERGRLLVALEGGGLTTLHSGEIHLRL